MNHTFRIFVASNRVVIVSLITGIASASLAICLHLFKASSPWAYTFLVVYAIFQGLLVYAASVQTFYSKVALLDSLLRAIHSDLGLLATDRIAIHILLDGKAQTYVQLTNYYPTKTGMGRVFHFTYGLTGRSFKTRLPTAYKTPIALTFNEAMTRDWAYTTEERMRLTQDRRSFFAMPVGQEGEMARGVIYMDSSNSETFAPERMEQISKRIAATFLSIVEGLLVAT